MPTESLSPTLPKQEIQVSSSLLRITGFTLLLVALLLAVALVSMMSGPVELGITQLWNTLWDADRATAAERMVVWELRLPRLLLGLLVGASLALAGAALQGLFRNPLADAGLLGVSSGAALAAVAFIVLGDSLFAGWSARFGRLALPLAAFGGGLLVTLATWQFARRDGSTPVASLLLAGIAINAIAGAGTGLLTYVADDLELRSLSFWTMGSLAFASWSDLQVVAPWMLGGCLLMLPLSKPLNAFLLGENIAGHLGYSTERIKGMLVVLSALVVGAAVAMTGPIGFVGLLVPHMVRQVAGANHQALLPLSALAGALLLVAADTVCRTLVAPAELPIGLVMALIGGPFFLLMLGKAVHEHA